MATSKDTQKLNTPTVPIHEILKKNPELEEKRKAEQRKYAIGNVANWKHGKKASYIALECDKCYAKEKCKHYQPSAVCVIRKELQEIIDKVQTRDKSSILECLEGLFRRALERYYINLYFEELDGGVIDKQVSTLEKNIFQYGTLLAELIEGKTSQEIILGDKIVNQQTQVNIGIGKMLLLRGKDGKTLGERLFELFDEYNIPREDKLPDMDRKSSQDGERDTDKV